MNLSILQTVLALADQPASGVYTDPPASEPALRAMQAAARGRLGEPVPDQYVALLRLTNGLWVENTVFKSAAHLVPENLDVLRPEVIALGHEGNTAEFVFDRRDRRYHIIIPGHVNERFASFDRLDDLLARVLEEQGVLE